MAYYLHALSAHGGQYMRALGSLGRYMNEGVECNHKETWQLYQHTSKGGGGSRPAGEQAAGAGERRRLVRNSGPSVTRQVMKRQSFNIFDEMKDLWDELTWEGAGMHKPAEGQSWTDCLTEQSPTVEQKRRRELELQRERRAAKRRREQEQLQVELPPGEPADEAGQC